MHVVQERPWESRQFDDILLHARMRPVNEVVRVYEVRELVKHEDGLLFRDFDERGAERWTTDVEAVTPLVRGTIQTDGCSHNTFADGGYVHACSVHEMTRLGVLFERLYNWAFSGPV